MVTVLLAHTMSHLLTNARQKILPIWARSTTNSKKILRSSLHPAHGGGLNFSHGLSRNSFENSNLYEPLNKGWGSTLEEKDLSHY